MSQRRFVHLGINPFGSGAAVPGATVPPNYTVVLEHYLDTLDAPYGDWFRYGSQNYVVWTSLAPDDLAKQIRNLPGFQNVYVLATEMGTTPVLCNGLMSKRFWEWLHRPRS